MASFVTLAELKDALLIDHNDDDAALTLYIEAATGAVVNYLKSSAAPMLELGATILPEVKVSVIFLVGIMWRNPDNDTESAFEQGFLPRPVTALLYPLRDPALA
ncbi:head-tail connector protein [Paenirhodobacter populi]|uniref:Phage gp6-like head-tail connector protein n=1 Tax=Paenirhodobacter populi TaxID=2306993 RepID=A0A443IQ64_9RHOB|nr:head-tail connector protein [Sinirhodobacter populi]RWR08506.1 phage gp6-like head-tail connector protein [Sinirhodobacter populi]